MSEPQVLLDQRPSAAWITLNRPRELNAMGPQLLRELNEALDRIEADHSVRCVVVTGAGRAFCAGADLTFLNGLSAEERQPAIAALLADATATMNRIEAFPRPVIAAVNGIVLAGGMELLLCCDLVVASETARLGDGHANYGLLPGAGASVRLPRRIGLARAKHLFFTGDLVSPAEMQQAGLVNQIVPADDLADAVERLAARIATKSPLGLQRMKELANRAHDLTQDQAIAFEQTVSALHAGSHDFSEGLTAFNEGRAPSFQGI